MNNKNTMIYLSCLLSIALATMVRAEVRMDGTCSVVSGPTLALHKGACVLIGKLLFKSGDVAFVADVKGDCNQYGRIFAHDGIECTHIKIDGHADQFEIDERSILSRFMQAIAPSELMLDCYYISKSILWQVVCFIPNTMWYSDYWWIADSSLACMVVGWVVYWFGYRSRKSVVTKIAMQEIASTKHVDRSPPQSMQEPPIDATVTRTPAQEMPEWNGVLPHHPHADTLKNRYNLGLHVEDNK
jgi:hypothetical protein